MESKNITCEINAMNTRSLCYQDTTISTISLCNDIYCPYHNNMIYSNKAQSNLNLDTIEERYQEQT